MRQQIRLSEAAALHQRQRASRTQSSRRIRLASPDRLHLDVAHSAQKNVCLLMPERRQGAADRILSPALRICPYRILEESRKRFLELRQQFLESEFARQIG